MKTNAIKGFIIPLYLTLLCLIFLVPNYVIAQGKPTKNVKNNRVEMATDVNKRKMELRLTDDQKAKIKDLRLEHMKAIRQLKAQNQEMVAHLKNLNLADRPDNKAIFKTIDDIMGTRGEILKRSISFKQAFKNILTPDQLKELELRQMNKHSEMGGRSQNWNRGNRNMGRGQMMQQGRGQMMQGRGQMMQQGRGQMQPGGMNNQGRMMQGQMQQRQAQMMQRQQMYRQRSQGVDGQNLQHKQMQPTPPDTSTVK